MAIILSPNCWVRVDAGTQNGIFCFEVRKWDALQEKHFLPSHQGASSAEGRDGGEPRKQVRKKGRSRRDQTTTNEVTRSTFAAWEKGGGTTCLDITIIGICLWGSCNQQSQLVKPSGQICPQNWCSASENTNGDMSTWLPTTAESQECIRRKTGGGGQILSDMLTKHAMWRTALSDSGAACGSMDAPQEGNIYELSW